MKTKVKATKPKDDNDRLVEGKLNKNPLQDCERFDGLSVSPTTATITQPEPKEPPTAPTINPRRLRDFRPQVMERLSRRQKGEEKPIPLPWPHVLQNFGGGLWPGCHILLGGTGSGKTQWALQVALHSARQNIPVLYVALELGAGDLVTRLAALDMPNGPKWSDLYLGKVSAAELVKVEAHAKQLDDLPIYFEFGSPGAWPYQELSIAVEKLRALHPESKDKAGKTLSGSAPMLVIVDFLQLVGDGSLVSDARSLELRERIGRASYAGRELARSLEVAVLLVSSAARDKYSLLAGEKEDIARAGIRPDGSITRPDFLLGLGKESGEIEFAADSVTALIRWNEDLPEKNKTSRPVILATSKLRCSPTRWCELRFDGARFTAPLDGGEALRLALEDTTQPKERATREKKEPAPVPFVRRKVELTDKDF